MMLTTRYFHKPFKSKRGGKNDENYPAAFGNLIITTTIDHFSVLVCKANSIKVTEKVSCMIQAVTCYTAISSVYWACFSALKACRSFLKYVHIAVGDWLRRPRTWEFFAIPTFTVLINILKMNQIDTADPKRFSDNSTVQTWLREKFSDFAFWRPTFFHAKPRFRVLT